MAADRRSASSSSQPCTCRSPHSTARDASSLFLARRERGSRSLRSRGDGVLGCTARTPLAERSARVDARRKRGAGRPPGDRPREEPRGLLSNGWFSQPRHHTLTPVSAALRRLVCACVGQGTTRGEGNLFGGSAARLASGRGPATRVRSGGLQGLSSRSAAGQSRQGSVEGNGAHEGLSGDFERASLDAVDPAPQPCAALNQEGYTGRHGEQQLRRRPALLLLVRGVCPLSRLSARVLLCSLR